MGRAKEVKYCNNRYQGSLTETDCENLETLIQIDKDNGVIADLRHIIYNLDDSDVLQLIEDYELCKSSLHDYEERIGTLRDEQTVGVCFLYHAGSLILGDSVGMGKTVEVAGLYNLLKTASAKEGKKYRYLMLTEKNIAEQIRLEMVKFTNEFVDFIKSGEIAEIEKFKRNNPYEYPLDYNVVGTHALFTAPAFLSWLEQARQYGSEGFPFDMLVVDESSCLGGKTTNEIVKGYKSIAKYFKRIVFLNATPFETKLGIFYNQLALIDPAMLPTKENFKKVYCEMDYRGMYPKPTGRYKNQAEFKRLIGYRYFARTRRDKGAVMEGCDGRVLYSNLSPIQKEWLKKSSLNRVVYDCPSHIDPSIEFNSENVPKLGSLNELLKNECANADSILIFVHFKEAQTCLSKWLTDKGISNRVLNGETGQDERFSIVNGFKNNSFRVLITNVQRGLNFGSCNHCIFYSFDPNPAKMIQFEGRTTRDFDIIGKNVYILCSLGQEADTLRKVVKERAKATQDMTNTDLSVVMSILIQGAYNDNN